MRNVTVALPDEVYRKARIKAAQLDTSLSAMVSEMLGRLGDEESDFERRKRLQDEVLATITRFSAAARLGRDDLHERRQERRALR
ncbi:MAG TPA: hypothetical protein VGS57_21405 [Thermoanaerobaculia bacterium]|nr:hypothetical protein [Thermoanaerobaculia bacterium]